MLNQRIKNSRRAAGLSLRNLAEKIDNRVTAQAISKYERGESMPSSGVLIALAGALGVSVNHLVSDSEMVLEDVEFRRKKLTSRREEARVEAKVLHLLERYLAVEEILGLPSVTWDKPREAPWPVLRDPAEAEHAALRLRASWGLGLDPIPNLVELLEERGIKALGMDLTNIDGLTARVRREDGDTACVIVVNRRDWGERQRFTAAHELGHMVLNVVPRVDDEKTAHRFAGAFLMPAETLRAEIGKRRKSMGWGEFFELKRIFGVSVQALTYRCKDLGIFGDTLFRLLFDEFTRHGWRSPPYQEPHAMPGEEPRRFERLCFRALVEGAISEAKAAELLEIPVHELNRRVEEPPGTPLCQGKGETSMRKAKQAPELKSERQEREFWESHDSSEYVDWSRAERVNMPNLKPSTKTISLRLPETLLDRIKIEANKRDMPYQSLIKAWLAEDVKRSRER